MKEWIIRIMTVIFAVLVLGSFIYVGTNEWNKFIYAKELKATNSGYRLGQEEMSKQLIDTLASCKSIQGRTVDNRTITIIAQECLQPQK